MGNEESLLRKHRESESGQRESSMVSEEVENIATLVYTEPWVPQHIVARGNKI